MKKQAGTHRFLSLLLSIMLVLGLFPTAALAAPTYQFGTEQVALTPGVYELGVALNKANDITSASMAGTCIQGGTLTVEEDGTAKVTVRLGPVSVGPISGWAKDWKVYQEYGYENTGSLADAAYTETTVDGQTVQDSITFTLPDNSWDGVYVNMYIDVMGMAQNAYLAFTWPEPAEIADVREGTAQVEQFGKYDVNVKVTVEDGKVAALAVEGANFGGTYAEVNKSKLAQAIDALKEFWNGKDITDAKAIYQVDAVSGATISSKAIRDAVMNALGLTYEEEDTTVPDSVAPGTYTVPVTYYTDVVLHYLTGSEVSDATLVVAEDGSMQLDVELVSGSSTEPLYLLDINGYYENNDKTGRLLTDKMTLTMGDTDYSDEYFASGTQVVTKVSLPLVGGLNEEYATNTRLYVPAMNNLNGNLGGVLFENGTFNVDSLIKIHWDELTAAGDGDSGQQPGEPLEGYPVEADLTCYTSAMGGIDFGDGMVTDAALSVKDGKAALTVALAPASFTIYGQSIQVSVDNTTDPLYYDGQAWTKLAYTTAQASDGTVYVDRITIPVTKAVDTCQLGLHISRYQFGGPDASSTSDGSKLEAVLNLTWSDEAKAALEDLILALDQTQVSLTAPKSGEEAVTATVTATVTGVDSVTVESRNSAVATAAFDQATGKITITPVAAGNTEIVVTAAAGENTVSKTIAVTVTSGSSGGGSSSGSDSFFLSDGNYYVDIALWNATSDQASMGNTAFKNNDQALITVKNGKVTKVQLATNPVDVSGYHSAITQLAVSGASVSVQETGSVTTEPAGNTYTYIKRASFTMPDEGQPADADDVTYLDVTFTVPDTPMDDVVSGGLEARLKFTWSTAQSTSDSSLAQDSSSASGTSSITGEEVVDVALTDKATGIKLTTDSQRLSTEATLSVEQLTSGDEYDTAAKAMSGVTGSWSLYSITALVDGKSTAPGGSVTLSIPCTADGLTVYRISSSGAKTVLKGQIKDGYYVLSTSSLGLFAIVGDLGQAASQLPFADVAADAWYYDAVRYVTEKGLFSGTSATAFSPDLELSRSMLVTVLYRLEGSPQVTQSGQFSDLEADSWYEDAVLWASANQLVTGYGNGSFGPNDVITREQLALILYRYAQWKEQDVSADADLSAYADRDDVSDFALDGMSWAVKTGLISGTSASSLSPKATATRSQVAVILMRYLEGLA